MKILLVRTDGLGDALVCAPLVASLRAAGHTIGALLSVGNARAFAARAFARVHVVERIPWPNHGSTPETRARALAEVRAERYDVALVASEEIDAFTFARDAGIGRRVGFVNGWQKPLKTLAVRPLLTRAIVRPASANGAREHEVETLFGLGRDLVDATEPTRDLTILRPLVLDESPVFHGHVALQVSAKYAASGLDVGTYVAIARALVDRDLSPLLLADDRDFAARIVGELDASVADIRFAANSAPAEMPRKRHVLPDFVERGTPVETDLGLDLETWKSRIAGATAIVTPDSGAAHVAGMTGVPCVDLFAAHAALANDIARWHPWAAPYVARALDSARDPRAFAAEIASDCEKLLGPAVRA